jgi:polar amino acid transport system substrate-binding protein
MKFKGNKFKFRSRDIFFMIILQGNLFPIIAHANQFKITAPEIAIALLEFENIVIESYQKIGISAEIIHLPAKRSLETARNSDWVDAELVRSEKLSVVLGDYIRIPIPILSLSIKSYGSSSKQCFPTWKSLASAKVAILRGLELIKMRLIDYKINYLEVESNEQAVAMLKANRIDAIVTPESLIDKELKTNLQNSGLHCMEELEAKPLYHYVRKKHHSIVPQLTNALQETLAQKQE